MIIVVVGMGIGIRSYFISKSKTNDAEGVIASKTLNKEYNFIARDAQGYFTDANINLKITTVQKQEEVLVKGNRATARNGKAFLIFEVSLKNDSNQVLYLNPLDLVRLVESDGGKVAPQVHQGNVEVRPQSTKKSNFGFIVEHDAKDFAIQIGELDGNKDNLSVKF
ncbi:DUF4352 domain-containing protein [candidate division WWE3 bacterium]|nr:DUF4352 domain-containing protein [candidate division WWE3 bacterium]